MMREMLYGLPVLSNDPEETMGKNALYQVLVYCGQVNKKQQRKKEIMLIAHIKNWDEKPGKK